MAICDHEEKLISRLEGILTDQIYNNGKQIRYPLTFNDGNKLKGKGTILATDNLDVKKFYSAHYKFGANEVYIYEAIKKILDELENLELFKGSWSEEVQWLYDEDNEWNIN